MIPSLLGAKEGSRALNNQIALAAGWLRMPPSQSSRSKGHWIAPEDVYDGKPVLDSLHGTTIHRDPPNFTGSVDCALSLLPQGTPWRAAGNHLSSTFELRGNQYQAPTLPLAICIAWSDTTDEAEEHKT